MYHNLIFSLSSLLSKFHIFLPMLRRSGCLQSSWLTRGVLGLALKYHLVKEISMPIAFCEVLFSWTVVPKPHFCSNSVSSKPNSHTSWHHMHKNNACFSISSCSVSICSLQNVIKKCSVPYVHCDSSRKLGCWCIYCSWRFFMLSLCTPAIVELLKQIISPRSSHKIFINGIRLLGTKSEINIKQFGTWPNYLQ